MFDRLGVRLAGVLAVASLVVAVCASTGVAAMRRSVIRPPTRGSLCFGTERLPHWGRGAYLAAGPCGFYIGRAFVGDRFESQRWSPSGFGFGRDLRLGLCGWIDPATLSKRGRKVRDRCSLRQRRMLGDQFSFGRNFNCQPHACRGPSAPVPLNAGCPRVLFYNYVRGRFRDRAPGLTPTSVRYRYTTLDGRAVVVLVHGLGWGFMPAACLTFQGYSAPGR